MLIQSRQLPSLVNKKGLRQKLFDDESVRDSAYWVVIKSLSIVSGIGGLFACLVSQFAGIITRILHSYLESVCYNLASYRNLCCLSML